MNAIFLASKHLKVFCAKKSNFIALYTINNYTLNRKTFFRDYFMKNILIFSLACCLFIATTGCNEEYEIPTELVAEKTALAEATRDLGDFYLQEHYYTEAKKQYDLAIEYADKGLADNPNNGHLIAFITEVKEILKSDPMIQGLKGKLLIGGKWVMPQKYLEQNLDKIEVNAKALKLLEDNWKSLKMSANRNDLANPVKTEEGQKILSLGKTALPFLVDKIRNDHYERAASATRLAFAIPDRDDVMLCLLLTLLDNDSNQYMEEVVIAAIEASHFFEKKSIVVALLNEVAKNKAQTTNAAITSMILGKSPLGQHMLTKMLSETPGDKKIKGYILANLYLYEDDKSVDLLLDFIAKNDKYLMLAASNSLLKMQSNKALPALNTVLEDYEFFQRDDIDQIELLVRIINRLGEGKYPGAVKTLKTIFTSKALIAEEPAEAAIKALNSIAESDDKAIETLLDLLMRNSSGNDQDKFWKEIAGYVINNKNEKVMSTLIETLATCERETAIKIAYTLGMCRDDSAVEAMAMAFKKFQPSSTRKTILPIIYNAFVTIGSQKSINEMFSLAQQFPSNESLVLQITNNIPAGEASKQACEFIFKNLRGDNTEFSLQVLRSFEKHAPSFAAPYIRALAANNKVPMKTRLGAIGALRPYSNNLESAAAKEMLQTIENIIEALEHTADQQLYFTAHNYLRGYKSPKLTKFYLKLLSDHKSGNWKLHSLAADCLLERKGDLVTNQFLNEVAQLRETYVKQKDFLTAIKLARFASQPEIMYSIRNKYIEETKKTFDTKNHPLKGGLLMKLGQITDILGSKYEIIPPSASSEGFKQVAEDYKFAYFPESHILIMFNNRKAAKSQIVKAIAYLPGCKFGFYNIKNGYNINAIAPMINPEGLPDQITFNKKYRGYALNFNSLTDIDPDRRLMFVMKEDQKDRQTIKYTAESLTLNLDVGNIDLMAFFDIANKIIGKEQPKP